MSSSGAHVNAVDYPYNGKVLLAAVISLSIVIFFVLLLHVYARWLLRRRPPVVQPLVHRRQLMTVFPAYQAYDITLTGSSSCSPSNCGLAADVVASLPVLVYETKEHEDEPVECVICLSLIEEDEKVRLLPSCKHIFHVECIDMWFKSHSTCPICRAEVLVKVDELLVVKIDGESVQTVNLEIDEEVVMVQDNDEAIGNADHGELSCVSSTVGGGDIVIEITNSAVSTMTCQSMKKDMSSSSSSSVSSSCGSLKRMLSRSRSESRVFP